MKNQYEPPQISFVRELCKDSTEEEIQAAETRLIAYLELCKTIAEEAEQNTKHPFDKPKDH